MLVLSAIFQNKRCFLLKGQWIEVQTLIGSFKYLLLSDHFCGSLMEDLFTVLKSSGSCLETNPMRPQRIHAGKYPFTMSALAASSTHSFTEVASSKSLLTIQYFSQFDRLVYKFFVSDWV